MDKPSGLLAYLKSSGVYALCKKYRHKLRRHRSRRNHTTSEGDIQRVLSDDLGIKTGSSILVHCGFGYLYASFSPERLVELLQEIVGRDGNILMPFYPPGLSIDWARAGRCFDMTGIKASTGILSQIFANTQRVVLSTHPIKSVAAWGANAEELISDHSRSIYPFDESSPYYKLAQISGSMTIGLGVRNCSMFHSVEDVHEPDKTYLYCSSPFDLPLRTRNGVELSVRTFVHHGQEKLEPSWDFFDKHLASLPVVIRRNNIVCYAVSNQQMISEVGALLQQGINRRLTP